MNNNQYEYFRIIEFQQWIGYRNTASVIHIDISLGELTYQVFHWKRNGLYISGQKSFEFWGRYDDVPSDKIMKVMKNEKTGFHPQIIQDDLYTKEVVFNYGIKLNEDEMKELLKYCNVLDFEPYRDRKMQMDDPGFIVYRDEVSLKFIGITNSYIPKMEWLMPYSYDEEHIWPSEKLYRYIHQNYLNNKKLKKWI